MEERWFQVGDSKPIQEGDMTLLVAKMLVPKLRNARRESFARPRQNRAGDTKATG